MKPIKIVQITTSLNYGGAERVIYDLVRTLNSEEFKFMVITVTGGGPYEDKLKALGVEVLINHKETRLGFGVFRQIAEQLRAIKPDIVHTHLFAGDFWGRLAAVWARVPVIITTAHNLDFDEGFLKKFAKWFLNYWTKRVIAVSVSVKDYLEKREWLTPQKIQVVYNGVEISRFYDPQPKVLQKPPYKLAIIGRLVKQKGHIYLIKALSQMKNREVILEIIGDGPLKPSLMAEVVQKNLGERVKFKGIRTDIGEYLKQVDVVVIPSLWEGFGLTAVEAALAGRPILASRVGGLKEILTDSKTACLVPAADARALAEALDSVIDNPVRSRQIGLSAQERARQFSLEKMTQEYAKVYRAFS